MCSLQIHVDILFVTPWGVSSIWVMETVQAGFFTESTPGEFSVHTCRVFRHRVVQQYSTSNANIRGLILVVHKSPVNSLQERNVFAQTDDLEAVLGIVICNSNGHSLG